MEYLQFYENKVISRGEVFNSFMKNIKTSIKVWEYFINWEKVIENAEYFKIELNLLNSLIGTENIKADFINLIMKYPEAIKVLPVLLAVREKKLELLKDYKNRDLSYLNFDFTYIRKLNVEDAERYFIFLEKSGLIKLFRNKKVKNFVDYVLGVEVGLDSNGRKNRGGTIMEEIVEIFIKDTVSGNQNLDYIAQATSSSVRRKWNYQINVDRTERRFDFGVFNKRRNRLFLIETNFYNGGGSKLKATCGEYQSVYNYLNAQNIDFIWITDGKGWLTTRRPLEETFNNNKYTFNLWLVQEGVLEALFNE